MQFMELRDTYNRSSRNDHVPASLERGIRMFSIGNMRSNNFRFLAVVNQPTRRPATQWLRVNTIKSLPLGRAPEGIYPFDQDKPHLISGHFCLEPLDRWYDSSYASRLCSSSCDRSDFPLPSFSLVASNSDHWLRERPLLPCFYLGSHNYPYRCSFRGASYNFIDAKTTLL